LPGTTAPLGTAPYAVSVPLGSGGRPWVTDTKERADGLATCSGAPSRPSVMSFRSPAACSVVDVL
jgi:hypothetical protein